jgi:DNA-binding NarL/FixJ family response regulator
VGSRFGWGRFSGFFAVNGWVEPEENQGNLALVEVNMGVIRALVVDHHPIVREGLRNYLNEGGDIEVIEAGDCDSALDLISQYSPDVILLDIEMPDMSGVEVIRKMCRGDVNARILILSAHVDETVIKDLFTLGVGGYLLKNEAAEVILEAVRAVASGQKGWFSRLVNNQMFELLKKGADPARDLTWRELEVVRALVGGATNREIGRLLNISEKTVEKHLERIFRKLEVTSRVEAAVMAVKDNLIK